MSDRRIFLCSGTPVPGDYHYDDFDPAATQSALASLAGEQILRGATVCVVEDEETTPMLRIIAGDMAEAHRSRGEQAPWTLAVHRPSPNGDLKPAAGPGFVERIIHGDRTAAASAAVDGCLLCIVLGGGEDAEADLQLYRDRPGGPWRVLTRPETGGLAGAVSRQQT